MSKRKAVRSVVSEYRELTKMVADLERRIQLMAPKVEAYLKAARAK